MSFSKKIDGWLSADIDDLLPLAFEENKPKSIILALPETNAPLVLISRDNRFGKLIVPTLFFAIDDPKNLRQFSLKLSEIGGKLMPLFHILDTPRTKKIVVFPFLFERGKKASDFIHIVTAITNSLSIKSKFDCASYIVGCHLSISIRGKVYLPESFPEAFDI